MMYKYSLNPVGPGVCGTCFPTEREAILKILLKEENIAEDVDIAKLAKDTAGFSGSDLKRKFLCIYVSERTWR